MTSAQLAGPGQDPGYLASLRPAAPATLRAQRTSPAVIAAAPLLFWLVVPSLVTGTGDDVAAYAVAVPVVLALGALALQRALLGRITPLDPGEPDETARISRSVVALRQHVVLGVAVAEAPVLAGLVLAVTQDALLPFAVGFVTGWPLMLAALPTTRRVEKIRERLEARGVASGLWAALLDRVD